MTEAKHGVSGGIFRVPASEALEGARSVLIAGAGGGFDVFAGVPLFVSLANAGKKVSLANLSFTYLAGTSAAPLMEGLWRVERGTRGERQYFPERYSVKSRERKLLPM